MSSRQDLTVATVTTLVPEFELVYALDNAGFRYAITQMSAGTPWNALREGQRVQIEVTGPPVRTLSARVLP